jgi:hypothetical protein
VTVILRRPFAVSWFVIPVVIDAIDGVFLGGPFTHIGEEISEVEPAFADLDASAAVPTPLPCFLVQAPLFHAGPGIVGWSGARLAHGGMAMTCLRSPFALKTSATDRVSARQIVADDDDFDAAVAEAQEAFVFGLSVREANDGQAAESLFRDGGSYV